MNISVPSRFACLKIEDDDHSLQSAKNKEVKKKPDATKVSKKPTLILKPDTNLKAKKPADNKQGTQTTSNKRKKASHAEQWEEWKQKDDEMVNGTYEQDLENAIMLSKLDYEHNKELYKKHQEVNGKTSNQTQSKKKKNKAISINEFLSSTSEKPTAEKKPENHVKSENGLKDHFFDDIKSATKEELTKEEIKEKRKKREVNIDKIVSLAQCQEKFEKERTKRLALQVELDKAKAEIAAVKERNKTLCIILGQGEILAKDKADVLVELTEEVNRLHVLLEQERSKVAALTSDSHSTKHKDKKSKHKGV